MKECINCKAILEDDELFCHECGTRQEEIAEVQNNESQEPQGKKCIHCGEEIEEDCTFCPFCGKSQTADNAEELDTHSEESIPEEKSNPQETIIQTLTGIFADNKKRILLIVIILFVVFIIGGFYHWNNNNRHSITSETQETPKEEKKEATIINDLSIKQNKHHNDLISFDDIIKTNGDFNELVKKHGFKYVEFQEEEARFPSSYYYKNCIVRNKDVVPSPEKGTPIRIEAQGTITTTNYIIEVFSDDVFKKLMEDFFNHVTSQDGNEYTFYWADGHVAKYSSISHKQNGNGGTILVVVPFTSWEEMEVTE